MSNKIFIKMAVISMLLAGVDIVMFSEGLVNLSLFNGGLKSTIASIAIILANIAVLFAEYKFYTTSTEAKYGYDMDKLKTAMDYKSALESCRNKKTGFTPAVSFIF